MSIKLHIEIIGWKCKIKLGMIDSKLLTMRFLRLLNRLLRKRSGTVKGVGMSLAIWVTSITPEPNDKILFLFFH